MARRKRRRSRMQRFGDSGWFPPSVPRSVKGGIKARNQRGAFGESWWGRRWIDTLESFDLGARLERGRHYARAGQVTRIDVQKGQIDARVQGSRRTPYRVKIGLAPLTRATWRRIAKRWTERAAVRAQLLTGQMPSEIEADFAACAAALFPKAGTDLNTECSCPDWSNPCKHIAAVYYLLSEEFDRDPFLIFQLRGLARSELTELLVGSDAEKRRPATTNVEPALESTRKPQRRRGTKAAASEPRSNTVEPALPLDPAAFWAVPVIAHAADSALPQPMAGERSIHGALLLRRLGGFPFWRGTHDFMASLDPIYARAAQAALELGALGTVPEADDTE